MTDESEGDKSFRDATENKGKRERETEGRKGGSGNQLSSEMKLSTAPLSSGSCN